MREPGHADDGHPRPRREDVVGEFEGVPGRREAIGVDIHADAVRHAGEIGGGAGGWWRGKRTERDGGEAGWGLGGPGFVGVVEEGLAVVGDDGASRGDGHCRVVAFRRRAVSWSKRCCCCC